MGVAVNLVKETIVLFIHNVNLFIIHMPFVTCIVSVMHACHAFFPIRTDDVVLRWDTAVSRNDEVAHGIVISLA